MGKVLIHSETTQTDWEGFVATDIFVGDDNANKKVVVQVFVEEEDLVQPEEHTERIES